MMMARNMVCIEYILRIPHSDLKKVIYNFAIFFFIYTTVQSPWSGRDQKLWELSDILVDGRISDQSYLQNDLVLKLVTKFWSHSLLLTFWLPRLVVEFLSFWSDLIWKDFFWYLYLEYSRGLSFLRA